ncbi:glycosyltransferase family 4 protein [Paenibacillus donghaensis]|uniref:Glycosyl transferase family 1 n=1 Tax=Paenibacillus donghaensis TaxID=414771 RepID=A0A2Z2KGY7_9BACL|nr:glycosyltransferase family 4 protein [Paenibacillus donghaensis]ASA22493.1 glycosyl transferase family 1 [Paenibacillus donghaensis]
MTSSYRVVWKGPVHRSSGLGIASREYVKALRRQGVPTSTTPAASGGSGSRKVLVYHHAPHTLNVKKERKLYNRIVINTVWETTRIPRRWIAKINQADAVCVPSRQNKQALRNSGIRIPIFIVPHGVNIREYRAKKKRAASRPKGKFTFISVFGFQHRKNPEALLRAYWEEFSASDHVELIIKTNGYAAYENQQWIHNRIKAYKARLHVRKSTAPIRLVSTHLSKAALKAVYAKGDAFVLPTRGEGVGLPFMESMASGVPVITTGWGGQLDFVTAHNSFLVRYRLQPPVASMNRHSSIARQFCQLFAEPGQLWAEPDITSLRKQMRLAYEHPQLCAAKGAQARKDIQKQSWGRSGALLKQAIERIL